MKTHNSRKKNIIYLVIFILVSLLCAFVIFYFSKLDSDENYVVVNTGSNWNTLTIEGLNLDIQQDYNNNIFLVISSKKKYNCAEFDYNFYINEVEQIFHFNINNIIEKKRCSKPSEYLLIKKEISDFNDWHFEIQSKKRIDNYNLSIVDNILRVIKIEKDDAEINLVNDNFSKFVRDKYIVLPKGTIRFRAEYFDDNSVNLLQEILNNIGGQELNIESGEIALNDIRVESFGTDAKYIIVKYIQIDKTNEDLKEIVSKYKDYDCYQSGVDWKNCISFDIRTVSGKRYCTWLKVSY